MAIDRMGPVDELLCVGDTIFEFRFNNEVVDLLRQHEARIILGNHERVFFGPQGGRARESGGNRRDFMDFLASQPWSYEVDVGAGKKLLMIHGSPFEPHDTYVYPRSPLIPRMQETGFDYIILGHTHHQMAIQSGRTLVINPGSTGDGRDESNSRALSYAILDTASGEVSFDNFFVPRPA